MTIKFEDRGTFYIFFEHDATETLAMFTTSGHLMFTNLAKNKKLRNQIEQTVKLVCPTPHGVTII